MAGEKILVVDDSKNIREIFSTAFEEYAVVTAANGKEAWRILGQPNDIDLLVLDVMMPDCNGLELLERLRRTNRHCKVVIMTAYSTKDIAIEALRLHADEYIEKPFDLENVKEVLRGLLRGERARQAGRNAGLEKVRLAQRLVEHNYNTPLSLKEIAEQSFVSYKYLSRVFKERTGRTFSQSRLRLKTESAKQLLKKTRCSIAEIAYKLGYQNPNAFMKMFKKCTTQTPSQFRRSACVKK